MQRGWNVAQWCSVHLMYTRPGLVPQHLKHKKVATVFLWNSKSHLTLKIRDLVHEVHYGEVQFLWEEFLHSYQLVNSPHISSLIFFTVCLGILPFCDYSCRGLFFFLNPIMSCLMLIFPSNFQCVVHDTYQYWLK
jgi:hypothetical protein